jgi:DNA polymerase-3 subunit delta
METKIGATNAVLASIREIGPDQVIVREFPLLGRDSLAGWIRERAAVKNASIDSDAVAELADLVGPNLWAMDGEIEKLSIYAGARPITIDDVQALVTSNRESSVFELVDAIMEKRTDAALAVTERLFRNGAVAPYLITMIARQTRMVAIAQELAARKIPQPEWAKRLGTTSNFVVRKTSEQARRSSPEAILGLYRLVLEADIAMKTGETTDELAFTELLAQAGALRTTPRPRSSRR